MAPCTCAIFLVLRCSSLKVVLRAHITSAMSSYYTTAPGPPPGRPPATGIRHLQMEVARFHPIWLAACQKQQICTCPYHPEHQLQRRGAHGPGWRCQVCSACLPVREVLMAKMFHHPWSYMLHRRCMFFLDRKALARCDLTTSTSGDYSKEELAYLRPAMS